VRQSLDKSADEAVHDLMREIVLRFVPVDLVTHNNNPVLFIPLGFSFEEALSFIESRCILALAGTLTKIIDRTLF
jgi:hypothetical protein